VTINADRQQISQRTPHPPQSTVDEGDTPAYRRTDAAEPHGEGMLWAVRSTLLHYVSHLPDGHAAITEGASLIGTLLHFPYTGSNSIDEATGAAHLRFAGSVRLLGYFGLLNIPILHPWITINDTGSGQISLHHAANGHSERITALQFASSTFHPDTATLDWDIDCSRPTPDGIALFGDSYSAEDEFDPIRIRIPRRPDPPPITYSTIATDTTSPATAQSRVGTNTVSVHATEVTGTSRDEVFQQIVDVNPEFTGYADKTHRTTPMLALPAHD
jgi:hypothetical protein